MACRAPLRCFLPAFVAAAACVGPALPAQDAALGADEAKVRWVDGRPMLKVTLRAGDRVYYCHLLVDLATSRPLYLHRNAAGSLRAEACRIEAGGIALDDVAFEQKRDTWLEGLTSGYAEELQQVPVAGIVGLGAFGAHDVVLDGPSGVLRLRAETPASAEAPPPMPGVWVLAAEQDVRRGVRLRMEVGSEVTATVSLHTRDPFSWLVPELCRRAGHGDGVLATARLAPGLDAARWTPFRPLRSQGEIQGGLGGAVLQQLVVTVQPGPNRVVLAAPGPLRYPEVEAAFQRAVFGPSDPGPLQQFLREHAAAPQAAEAAHTLLEWLVQKEAEPAALQEAGLWVVQTAPKHQKGTAALHVLEHLAAERPLFAARAAVATAGLADARADEDGNAAHKLRLELGRQQRVLGNQLEARRHLLAAVFGMPASGAANLELGHWHREQRELEAALGRYFLALLDMKDFGQQGYQAFASVFAALRPGGDLLAELQDRADGRVPALQPIPRDPASVRKTGRTALVELFTGAMCPPCVAADVGCDALAQLYDADEVVLLQWHLPVPAPEPMVSPASAARAEARGVGSTPTVLVAGGEPVVGGGKVDAAPDLFRRYRELVDAELALAPVAAITGSARLAGTSAQVTARITPQDSSGKGSGTAADPKGWRAHILLVESLVAFPGGNGMLFHHEVVRGSFVPDAGVPVGGEALAVALDLGDVQRELDEHVRSFESERVFLVRPVQLDPRRLAVVVFVQDRTGRVLQAARWPLVAEAGR
ncbi:MAG: hypothetical protein JNK49_11215 [Planctomycetes bacterium]|nr:hypothetical protein [Planctomycetota bacterium]